MLKLLFASANNSFNVDMCHLRVTRYSFRLDMLLRNSICPAGQEVAHIHIECEQREHISNFEPGEKYIEFAQGKHIDKKKGY